MMCDHVLCMVCVLSREHIGKFLEVFTVCKKIGTKRIKKINLNKFIWFIGKGCFGLLPKPCHDTMENCIVTWPYDVQWAGQIVLQEARQ